MCTEESHFDRMGHNYDMIKQNETEVGNMLLHALGNFIKMYVNINVTTLDTCRKYVIYVTQRPNKHAMYEP